MLTMDTVEKLVSDIGARSFMRRVLNDNLHDQDNARRISDIAERLDVESDDIYACIWLRNLIKESDGEVGSYEDAMIFADRCGVDLDVFKDCIERQNLLRDAFDAGSLPLTQSNAADGDWQAFQGEEQEAFLKGMNLFEHREYLADLRCDAGLQRD